MRRASPSPPAVIRVVREKTGLSYAAETDTAGFYVVVVHLHDEDLLDRLLVGAGTTTIRVEAQFEPGNGTDPRAAFLSTLEKYLGR